MSDTEWEQLGELLAAPAKRGSGRGRPRLQNDRAAAEACLFRHFHSLAPRYRSFGWNELPAELGVAPATANRRFREWSASGAWKRFWDALAALRHGRPQLHRQDQALVSAVSPVLRIIKALESAYQTLNQQLFVPVLGTLGPAVITLETDMTNAAGCLRGKLWHGPQHQAMASIAISATRMDSGPEQVIETLIHEMVHLRNRQCGIPDCSKKQYHNRHFRDVGLRAGLEFPSPRDPSYGYARTCLGPKALKAVRRLRLDEEAFAWRYASSADEPAQSES